ncbi:SDR family oxidoreductase [Gryllotalpicola protaetiae]|uniref:SDR family NAD(P)-dependent oxidoreductase n=1 Tax=Gryllotalpicola protaetiae TaxID=2419771 RepID=A0A387BSC0_9MICO|nr:SDR family oxidoreductase [Gryllotalpicola protaetiae]AYG03906.1 SDR family NAD(P)-dependent oxidoreductase [Gryllotalpicola protaetiae]
MVSLNNAVVLVTGANGGLGREFVAQALQRGAAKVYATARTPQEWRDPRVVALRLDVTDSESIAAAAAEAADTTVVVNNAGIYRLEDHLISSTTEEIRAMFETNFFGPVEVVRRFAPVLARNGGGAVLDVHSVLSWIGLAGSYSAAKAALWSATNSFRLELAGQGTHVTGLHVGYIDTPMIAAVDAPKNDPADVVKAALDGVEAEEYEVLADELTVNVKAGLSARIEDLYSELAATRAN